MGRTSVETPDQHILKHALSDFPYANASLPATVSNVESTLNYLLAVLYPQTKTAVADVASLPLVGNALNDMRVVQDNGDGKAASYRWEQREGEVAPSWHLIYDMDWGSDSILQAFMLRTQDVYVYRFGYNDLDGAGNPLGGDLAGQAIYGGASANTHLTLFANSGDGTGPNTGFVQLGDQVRPLTTDTISLGTSSYKFLNAYLKGSLLVNTMTLATGSITDSTGAISFGAANLTTSGWIKTGTLTLSGGSIADTSGAISFGSANITTTGDLGANKVTATGAASSFKTGTTVGTLTFADGSITCSGGSISFDNENLSTTGSITGGSLAADNLKLDANTLSSTNVNGNIVLTPNGAGKVSISSAAEVHGSLNVFDGNLILSGVGVTLEVGDTRITGNTISTLQANLNLILDPDGTGQIEFGAGMFPTTNSSWDIGKTGSVWNKLWIDGSIGYGANEITIDTLLSFSSALTGAATGMTLFYNSVSGKWEASAPDTEIAHSTIAGLTTSDSGHTQFVMLSGRSTGQTVIGGLGASENLTLSSTAHATKGSVVFTDLGRPNVDDSLDFGTASYRWKNVYTSGQFVGLRVENSTTAGRPSAAVANKGRLLFDTNLNDLLVDIGGAWLGLNVDRWVYQDTSTWNGTATTVTYTVDGSDTPARGRVSDARLCLWVLKDNTNGFRQIVCDITAAATTVTVTLNDPLPAGTYTLIGLG